MTKTFQPTTNEIAAPWRPLLCYLRNKMVILNDGAHIMAWPIHPNLWIRKSHGRGTSEQRMRSNLKCKNSSPNNTIWTDDDHSVVQWRLRPSSVMGPCVRCLWTSVLCDWNRIHEGYEHKRAVSVQNSCRPHVWNETVLSRSVPQLLSQSTRGTFSWMPLSWSPFHSGECSHFFKAEEKEHSQHEAEWAEMHLLEKMWVFNGSFPVKDQSRVIASVSTG